jgi:class 3 adenylate cyclase
MSSLPQPISLYLHNLFVRGRMPAFLCVDDAGKAKYCGGDLGYYHLDGLQADSEIDKQLPILCGLFPLRQDRLIFPMVEVGPERFAEIHVFGGGEDAFVLFLDQSQEAREAQARQQVGNELALLREKHQKILDQYLGHEVTEELVADHGHFQTQGERRELSILFADIRGFTTFSAGHAPEQIFKTLNLYLEAMILSILREHGVVDKIIGDGVMALFGVLPAEHRARGALRAARGIQEAIRKLRRWNIGKEADLRGVGVGIASGVVTLGVIGVSNRRSFTAVGHFVNLAARLESQALPGEVLVDEPTLRQLGEEGSQFVPKTKTLKGISEPVTVYSLTLPTETDAP